MQDAFVLLVVIVVVLGGMVAVYAVATSGRTYREIGKGGLDVPADDAPPAPSATPAPAAVPDDGDEEIRELLEARNTRRERRGEPPLDVDAQLAALTSGGGLGSLAGVPASDELRDELRALVEARNRRRERAGLPSLDVDAEVERRLRDDLN